MNFLVGFALLVSTMGAAAFPDDAVTWRATADPVTYDAATGVVIYTAEPSADVGCDAPRFVVMTRGADSDPLQAVYCRAADGTYSLLFN